MSVSIEKTFKNAFSGKYDKVNLLSYMLIISILQLLYAYLFNSNSTTQFTKYTLFGFLVYIVLCVISGGYSSLTTYNDVQSKDNVLPSIEEAGNILKNGIKWIAGTFALNMIFIIPILILLFVMSAILGVTLAHLGISKVIIPLFISLFMIFGCIIYIYIVFRYIIPLSLNFLQTLDMKEFFAFSKVKSFLQERKGNYLPYIVFSILIMMLGCSIAGLIVWIFSAIGILANLNMSIITTVNQTIIGIIVPLVCILFIPNLNAQFINSNKHADDEEYEDYEEVSE